MKIFKTRLHYLAAVLPMLAFTALDAGAADDESMTEDGDELLIIDDESIQIDGGIGDAGLEGGSETEMIEGIEVDGAAKPNGIEAGDDLIVIDEEETSGGSPNLEVAPEGGAAAGRQPEAGDGEILVIDDTTATQEQSASSSVASTSRGVSFKVDDLWAEYGRFVDSDSEADNQGYLHGLATLRWLPNAQWEFQAAARVDGYYQWGGQKSDSTKLDYGDSFARYRDDRWRLTVGADTVIWGRIDEFAPTDRVSVVDLSRFILDDLPDRRRAAPIIRAERFFGNSKLDMVFLPIFREAVLPEEESLWYPINRETGQVIGIESDPQLAALVKTASYKTGAPSTDAGFGVRFSESRSGLDYALTVQKNRQSVPYFKFEPAQNAIVAEYPRSWVVGGDLGFEAAGVTWRLEAAWFSDTPVTEVNNIYTTVNSVSYGGGAEFYPGDGDTRVNIQLTGMNLIDSPDVIDRTRIYSLNGSMEAPFAHNKWRVKARFYVGLGENDVYINPEVAYVGWEPSEIYLGAHYFNGADGTPGGFHENHSLVTLGWRARF